ncbi:MAG TPA: HD domain-containing protein [Candidatus Binataceae bacterium]|nr:HD domain-containing protein [Candidatus Binataceae bacterium]
MDEQISTPSPSQRADALERQLSQELDRIAVRSVLYYSGERDPTGPLEVPQPPADGRLHYYLMGPDPRLKPMPDKPTLMDFFRNRFGPAAHLLQSAALARKAGHEEKVIIACLLHDIGVSGFIRSDHGYWGAQLVEPYVDEEVSWAIRAHQVLRFYPDPEVGYEYPEMYLKLFGADYRPEPYIERAYRKIRNHRWYMTARLITVNDIYSFDPKAVVNLEEFTDIIGRNFRQPEEGLGFDDSPSAHMWRTINWPTRFL